MYLDAEISDHLDICFAIENEKSKNKNNKLRHCNSVLQAGTRVRVSDNTALIVSA
jgi:hypothetical protein